jgi:hypothetical protein
LVIQAAVALGLENGKKLRVDTTVVETDIHRPMDNTLLWDTVRVVTAWSESWMNCFRKACRDLPIGIGVPGAACGVDGYLFKTRF